jgi:signal transduction histidine kinase
MERGKWDRCRTLFEDSPISLWEEDFSDVRVRLLELAASQGDLEGYLRANSSELGRFVALMRVLDVNPATLRLYRATSREQLLGSLALVASPGPGPEETIRSLLSIAAGEPSFETETVNHALDGSPIDIYLRWHVAKGHESDYGRVIVSIIDITTRKQAELALMRSREELRSLAAYQESAREEERTRISREIHDLLGQDLTAIKLDLAWLRQRMPAGQDALVRKIESMTALVDSTAKTVRRISKQLRPAMLDDLGLVEAVSLHLREFEERTGIACALEPPDREMPENRAMATAFFRILQEALTNVVRHAEASRVTIFLQCDGKFGTLRITDDGKGIRPEQAASEKSFGLIGIRERVAALGGTVTVTGEPGRGTTIEVKVPCSRGGCRC